MHCLEVIVRRNAEAAGREAAHARNDGDEVLFARIFAGSAPGLVPNGRKALYRDAFNAGYERGRQEG